MYKLKMIIVGLLGFAMGSAMPQGNTVKSKTEKSFDIFSVAGGKLRAGKVYFFPGSGHSKPCFVSYATVEKTNVDKATKALEFTGSQWKCSDRRPGYAVYTKASAHPNVVDTLIVQAAKDEVSLQHFRFLSLQDISELRRKYPAHKFSDLPWSEDVRIFSSRKAERG